ncbi:MAG TPA: S53 family peptidase [Gaiellales bacterium]|nr:S53 family peptidase [Gaiellales bacterium]
MQSGRLTRATAVAVLACLAALAASPAQGRAGTGLGAPARLAGSRPMLPAGARAVQAAPAAGTVSAVVYLKPRNPGLLARIAARTSGRPPLSHSQIAALFMPTAATVARVGAYLTGEGLTVTGASGLWIRARGSVATAGRAFGSALELYREPGGRTFRAPSSALAMPSTIAAEVQAVGGLQTNLQLRPAAQLPAPLAVNPTATCSGATSAQASYGGYLPQNIESGYDFTGLQQTAPGAGETVGLVEFSAFASGDITAYRNCVSGITGAFPVKVSIDGGNTSLGGGRVEAALDIEVVEATAPAAAIRVYEAPNDLSEVPAIIQQMETDGVTVASDSWGLCEPLVGPSLLGAENNALQVAASGGMSFYAASGDSGASDCKPVNGSLTPSVDDPASQPFVTGVGGTTLKSGAQKAWTDSGGGVSGMWTRPAYQVGFTRPVSAYHCTSSTTTPCREVPDLAMNADPNTGYVIYCGQCFGTSISWAPVGGTSAAAPLAAGMTALANQYSLANGGQRMGFANPFLYSTSSNTNVLWDVTSGGNNIGGGGYSAGAGYDMVTGLGSLRGTGLGQALAAYRGGAPSTTPTVLTITSRPPGGAVVAYPHTVTFAGHLADNAAHAIAGAPVHLQSASGSHLTTTDASGNWTITFAPRQNASWEAVYAGSDTYSGSQAPSTAILVRVRPSLTARAGLTYSRGRYHAATGRAFTVSGTSSPNMHGAVVTLEYHIAGYTRWHIVKTVAVGVRGGFKTTSVMRNPQAARYYRWVYTGRAGYRWVSAVSHTILITTP